MSSNLNYKNEQVKASLKHARISPLKLRKVADKVRNVRPTLALQLLRLMPQKGAKILYDLFHSCISNASNNFSFKPEHLVVSKLLVNEGPKIKRHRPRARGRAFAIVKMSSHVELVLERQGDSNGSKN